MGLKMRKILVLELFTAGMLTILSARAIQPLNAIKLDSRSCAALLESWLNPKPVMVGPNHEAEEVPEGNWAEFLARQITLSDATTISYRDFDRLGPGFWALHREDWERVAAQISGELREELTRRGIGYSGIHADKATPLNRYTVLFHDYGEHGLAQIVKADREQHERTVLFSPAAQMGIRTHGVFGSGYAVDSYLPLSWLGATPAHVESHQRTSTQINPIVDDQIITMAYLLGERRPHFKGMFANDWANRQSRRGSRVFRAVTATIGDHSTTELQNTALKLREITLSGELAAAANSVRTTSGTEALHRSLAEKLSTYLELTGIPNIIRKAPDGISYDVHLTAMSDASWADVYSEYTPNSLDKAAAPALMKLARLLKAKNIAAVFNTLSFANLSSRIDPMNGRYVLFPIGAFARQPVEALLIEGEEIAVAPDLTKNMLQSFGSAAQDGVTLHPWNYLVNARMARGLHKDLLDLATKRLLMDPDIYLNEITWRLSQLDLACQQIQRMQPLVKTFAALDAKELTFSVIGRGKGLVALELKSKGKKNPYYLTVKPPKESAELRSAISLKSISSAFDETRAKFKPMEDAELSSLLDFVEQTRLGIQGENTFTDDELEAIARNDQNESERRLQSLKSIEPQEYFHALFRDLSHWQNATIEAINAFKTRAVNELSQDDMKLKEFISSIRTYCLRKERGLADPNGVDFFVVDGIREILQAAGPLNAATVIGFAKEMLQTSQSTSTRRISMNLLLAYGARDEEIRRLILDRVIVDEASSDEGDESYVAIMALGGLFPDDAARLLPKIILQGSRKARTAAFATLLANKIFTEAALIAAAQAFGLDTNGTPGADGYLLGSQTTLPAVISAIKTSLRKAVNAGTTLYYISRTLRGLRLFDDEILALAIQRVATTPDAEDGTYELIYDINPRHPLVVAHLVNVLHGHYSIWKMLEALDIIFRVAPRHPALAIGIAAIKQKLSTASYGGFDYQRFEEISRAVAAEP